MAGERVSMDAPHRDVRVLLDPTSLSRVAGVVRIGEDGLPSHRWEGSAFVSVPDDMRESGYTLVEPSDAGMRRVLDALAETDGDPFDVELFEDDECDCGCGCSHCGRSDEYDDDEYDGYDGSSEEIVLVADGSTPAQPVFAILDVLDPAEITAIFTVFPGPVVQSYNDGTWAPDAKVASQISSPDVPPIVKLSDEGISRLVGERPSAAPAPVVADASAMPGDLKDYWRHGKGAAKIRWGTDGSFRRCQKQFRKYMRPDQVDGACASAYRAVTGRWPGRKKKGK